MEKAVYIILVINIFRKKMCAIMIEILISLNSTTHMQLNFSLRKLAHCTASKKCWFDCKVFEFTERNIWSKWTHC